MNQDEAPSPLFMTITRGQLKNPQLDQTATEILRWINSCADSPLIVEKVSSAEELMVALKSGVILCKVHKELSFLFSQEEKKFLKSNEIVGQLPQAWCGEEDQ